MNENTPRSEIMVPSMSGGVLNVAQAQSALRSVMGGAKRVRTAGLSGLAASVIVSTAAAAAPDAASGQSAGGARDVTVHINGPITIPVPAGVTDPHAIAEIAADLLGHRVEATFAASFSD